MACQVADPSIATRCYVTDSAGIHCENPEPHDAEHWISAHTIDHSCMGNGYSCDAVARKLGPDERQVNFNLSRK